MRDIDTWRMISLMGITTLTSVFFYRLGHSRGRQEGWTAGRSFNKAWRHDG